MTTEKKCSNERFRIHVNVSILEGKLRMRSLKMNLWRRGLDGLYVC